MQTKVIVKAVLVVLLVVGGLLFRPCYSAHAADNPKPSEDAIPLEKRIEILRQMIKDLDADKQRLIEAYAERAVDFKQTQSDVEKTQVALDEQKKRIDQFTQDLGDPQKKTFTYQGKDYTRDEVQAQLKQEVNIYKIKQAELDAKKELLDARKAAKDVAFDATAALNKQRDELTAKLDQLLAELAKAKAGGDK